MINWRKTSTNCYSGKFEKLKESDNCCKCHHCQCCRFWVWIVIFADSLHSYAEDCTLIGELETADDVIEALNQRSQRIFDSNVYRILHYNGSWALLFLNKNASEDKAFWKLEFYTPLSRVEIPIVDLNEEQKRQIREWFEMPDWDPLQKLVLLTCYESQHRENDLVIVLGFAFCIRLRHPISSFALAKPDDDISHTRRVICEMITTGQLDERSAAEVWKLPRPI